MESLQAVAPAESASALPDVSRSERPPAEGALDWVGMQGIDLPVQVNEPGCRRGLHALADVQVDLPAAQVKGIHMSRLYLALDEFSVADAVLTAPRLNGLLQALIDSHRDCGSRNARLRLQFALLVRRPALLTQGLAGWRAYPVRLSAALADGRFSLHAQVEVVYSSTCPCSAALSRQLVEQGFLSDFAGRDGLDPAEIAVWLRRNASLATPHSQRSEARVEVRLASDASVLGLMTLVDRIEQALGTPVQTAVKRADEQAFAERNGRNLMFVEDAARRIRHALRADHADARVQVRHLESLHPHDAVAWASDAAGNGAAEALES